jgi:hypothetical protein
MDATITLVYDTTSPSVELPFFYNGTVNRIVVEFKTDDTQNPSPTTYNTNWTYKIYTAAIDIYLYYDQIELKKITITSYPVYEYSGGNVNDYIQFNIRTPLGL